MTALPILEPPATRVGPRAVLRPVRRCVVREQVDQFLVYNADTDEMHLVPPLGMHAYWLCDGTRVAEDVALLLADAAGRALDRELADGVYVFLNALVARRLLELAPGAPA